MGKLLSIIVPSYNMEHYLPKCLGSLIVDDPALLRQLDVIVVNDGSKDRTSEIAHEFEAKYRGVFRVIDKANGNYGSCINAALPMAAGKYVKVLDADDWFDADGLKNFLGFVNCHDADLVISDYSVVTMRDGGFDSELKSYSFPVDSTFTLRDFVACNDYLPMHAFTYAVRCLREINYTQCEGVSYSDTEWIMVPLCNIHKVVYAPVNVYQYLRGREGQTMDPSVRAKNLWMQGEIAIHAVGQYERISKVLKRSTEIAVLRDRLLRLILHIYRDIILESGCFAHALDLRSFDQRLLSTSREIYDSAGRDAFSRHLPIRLIQAWRGDGWGFWTIKLLCRVYSAICSKIGVIK